LVPNFLDNRFWRLHSTLPHDNKFIFYRDGKIAGKPLKKMVYPVKELIVTAGDALGCML
jgi:hypothetical protein